MIFLWIPHEFPVISAIKVPPLCFLYFQCITYLQLTLFTFPLYLLVRFLEYGNREIILKIRKARAETRLRSVSELFLCKRSIFARTYARNCFKKSKAGYLVSEYLEHLTFSRVNSFCWDKSKSRSGSRLIGLSEHLNNSTRSVQEGLSKLNDVPTRFF